MAVGVLLGPDPFLGVSLPSAAGWGVPWRIRMLAAVGVLVVGVASYRHVRRCSERRYGRVSPGEESWERLDRLHSAGFWAFILGASMGWRWPMALGAMGLLMVAPLKWRRDGGVVPSHTLGLVLLPGLTLALPEHEPAVNLYSASVETLLVLAGAYAAVGGILDHLFLVRSFPRAEEGAGG